MDAKFNKKETCGEQVAHRRCGKRWQKRYPIKNENSGFGFNPFPFLHSDFSIFLFGRPISAKEGNIDKLSWILGFQHRKRSRILDVSFLSSKFRPLFTWPTRRDSNPRPPESESVAISSFATDGNITYKVYHKKNTVAIFIMKKILTHVLIKICHKKRSE